jgi:hypothetical protein
MSETVVGLFKDRVLADEVVREIESLGFARNEVRTVDEPLDLAVTGVMSIPHVDFEVSLSRELLRIGASRPEMEALVDGLRNGGVLVFATGSGGNVEQAIGIMNRHGAAKIEESTGPEPLLPRLTRGEMMTIHDSPTQAGRILEPSDGACFFVW